jgi:hypothetical protein
MLATSLNLVRTPSSEGLGSIRYDRRVREKLRTDAGTQRFFARESDTVPSFCPDHVRRELGQCWDALPAGALHHDNVHLKAATASAS